VIDRVFAQLQAFEEITCTCDRCERATPLAYLIPVAVLGVGVVCVRCLHTIPQEEFMFLRGRASRYVT
jgi:hypothetical protein